MKKLQLAFLMVIGSGSLLALPTFNPMGPALLKEGLFFDCSGEKDCCQPVPNTDWCDLGNWSNKDLGDVFGLRVGYYGDFVWNRKLYQTKNQVTLTDGTVLLDKTLPVTEAQMVTNSALVGVSIMDRFNLFATLGAAQANFRVVDTFDLISDAGFPPLTISQEVWTRHGFAWSVGGTAILWSCDCVAVGANGQYFQAKPHYDSINFGITSPALSYNPHDLHKSKWDWREWQVGVGGAWWIHLSSTGDTALVPYVNVKYAEGRGKTHAPLLVYKLGGGKERAVGRSRTKPVQNLGYALGATLVAGNRVNITVEGRWLDEKAISTQAVIRF